MFHITIIIIFNDEKFDPMKLLIALKGSVITIETAGIRTEETLFYAGAME
jgi:uncharacterized membrane protein